MPKEPLQCPLRIRVSATILLFLLAASGVNAQQVTGTLGSADATTTINGKQIPPPPPKFGGVIKETAKHPGGRTLRPDNRWGFGMIRPREAMKALLS